MDSDAPGVPAVLCVTPVCLLESALLEKIKKNRVSRALFLVQKAVLAHRHHQDNSATQRILEVRPAPLLYTTTSGELRTVLSSVPPSLPDSPPSSLPDSPPSCLPPPSLPPLPPSPGSASI